MKHFMFFLASVVLAAQTANPPYLNADLPAGQRAKDLVSRMTLEEKVLQMQNSAPAVNRLGIPAYDWWNEALHGVARAGQATVFPQAIGLAATWDTDLMHRIADVISTEARAKYNQAIRNNDRSRYRGLTFWSPNINIFRDPRWGRGQETYGEDPFLTSRMAVAFIQGMQGDDPHYYKVIATAKHYAVHSGPEPARHEFNAAPSQRDLLETYLPAFRASVVEAKADSVMCAYNSVDGQPACANDDLLQKRLRGEWGFQGYIVSDCGAIRDIYEGHKYKPSAAEASAAAVKAGTDLTCGTEYRALLDAVRAGNITEAEIDKSLERLFVARFKLGMFDPPERVPFSKIPYSVNDSAEHRQVALEAARKSIVLLKNDNQTLPLKPAIRKIAVIGPAADDPEALLGNYNGFSSKIVTPLEGMQRQFGGTQVRYSLGSAYIDGFPSLIPASLLSPLLAEYFDNADLRGQPKLQRTEPRPYLLAGMADPAIVAAGVPQRAFSVRWTGTLRPALSGDYLLGVRGIAAAPGGPGPLPMHVFLDDREVVGDAAQPGLGRVREAHAQLEAGRAYRIRVEYKQPNAGGNAQLVWAPPAEAVLAEAVASAKESDVAVAFLGLNSNLEGEEMNVSIPGFLGGDRTDLNLPASQERLIEALIATGKPVIVVLTTGSALAANFAAERAAAVIEAWYGGEEIGTAIAETLAGKNNPAGRLPVTFYRSADQLPAFNDYSMKGRTYRYFAGQPLYGFGFGLSYSKFEYSRLRSRRTTTIARVSARVRNSSNRDGDEVVQLYISRGGSGDALRELRAFQRIHLRAGEARDVEFEIPASDVPANKTRISIGGGQPVGTIPRVEGKL
jgi:beta-glucosidase